MADLKQARILVTRPAHQAENLCNLICINNGISIRFPTLEIVSVVLKLDEIEHHLTYADWFIFTSTNAVHLYCSQLDDAKMRRLKTKSCLAIGQATAQALTTVGLNVDLMPLHGYNSEALLDLAALQDVSQKNIVIIRGENGREILADTLKKRDANVSYQNVYCRKIPKIDCTEVLQLIDQKSLDLITITSGEAIQNLVKMLCTTRHDLLKKIPLIVVSERIQTIAKNLGFETIARAQTPSDDAILNTITTIINGEESG
ncbi:MAG: uroporphyrinogen-III synthase [Methylococcales bacterium]|nr:uroporphyrinogen-III synthase [Methylococcales bacterium]MDD5754948.1 uroporphyrinogen-III synthase [Methylococcales bacterium]